jgi:hypothetical protein
MLGKNGVNSGKISVLSPTIGFRIEFNSCCKRLKEVQFLNQQKDIGGKGFVEVNLDSRQLETKFFFRLYGFHYSMRTSARAVLCTADSYRLPFQSVAQ